MLDLSLGILKIGVGIVGNSQALVADGVHSLSDLASDGLVIWAMKYGAQEADPEHPYGHERIQTLATVLLGVGLVAVAFGLGKNAIERLLELSASALPGALTLVVAALSIVSKEWIYHYTMRVARKLRSSLLEANAWHSRTDALSSVVVFVGIAGSLMGFGYLDAVAAIIVAAMVMKVGGGFIIVGVKELVDTGADLANVAEMRQTMLSVEGVENIEQFRTRMMGSTIVADVNIQVSPDISVSEGHRISEEVEDAVAASSTQNIDITVHVDSEFTHTDQSKKLPLRSEVEREITHFWSNISEVPFFHMGLHYRESQIDVDLYFSQGALRGIGDIDSSIEELRRKVASDVHIGEIDAFIRIE